MLTKKEISLITDGAGSLFSGKEKPDNIRIAYEWLDAQTKKGGQQEVKGNIAELISNWSGAEITVEEAAIAVFLHPDLQQGFNGLNIDPRLVFPSAER